MHRHQISRTGIDEGSYGIRRVVVIRFHEPTGLVSSDADQKVIDLRKQLGGLAIVTAVAAVASKINRRLLRLDDVASPQTPISVEQRSSRPVPYGKEEYPEPRVVELELLEPAGRL